MDCTLHQVAESKIQVLHKRVILSDKQQKQILETMRRRNQALVQFT